MIFKGDNRNSGGLFGYELELVEKILKVLEGGRQESLPTILCEPDSFGGRSEPPKTVITRECPRDSLGLLSPLRCSAKLRSYPHTPDLSHKIVGRDSWLFFINILSLVKTRRVISVIITLARINPPPFYSTHADL